MAFADFLDFFFFFFFWAVVAVTSGTSTSIKVGDVLPEWGVDNSETAMATLSVSGDEIDSSRDVVLKTML